MKGNIDRKGEKIYHTSWSGCYARTKIDTSKGEAWFSDEAEAIAAMAPRAPEIRSGGINHSLMVEVPRQMENGVHL